MSELDHLRRVELLAWILRTTRRGETAFECAARHLTDAVMEIEYPVEEGLIETRSISQREAAKMLHMTHSGLNKRLQKLKRRPMDRRPALRIVGGVT